MLGITANAWTVTTTALGTNSFSFWKDGQVSSTLTFNGGWPATTNHPTLANYIEIGGRRDGRWQIAGFRFIISPNDENVVVN